MKRILLTSLSLFVCALLVAQVSPKEKQALIDFYLATQGEHWVNTWNLNEPVSQWEGVTVTNNKVTAIQLLFNNIEGELPNSIGDLEHLTALELSFNKISGSLPESLGNLTQLKTLAFNSNNLSGPVPATLGQLSLLEELHLSSNNFTGTLPTVLGTLENITVFNVFDNDLSGEIPAGLANHRNLRELMVAENSFEDTGNFSVVLLTNSGAGLDLNRPSITPSPKTIIAIEGEEEGN
ncbi:leucine-rich repeat domain-containing protein [Candidatus Ulvibacter alkanivorans]|uniref:leucine-rich repeat domain-containing protein n=1 Tax=Candidatus Ulvibacter alkanivorans TaxID=2267620 RepID=UPI000DF28BA8|nr:Two component regulator three Y domain protein [Candidatus Ulvibacter alkanivorans]